MSDEQKRDDGGSAFPQIETTQRGNPMKGEDPWEEVASYGGMTLRDYFAGQAMLMLTRRWIEEDEHLFSDVAANCYDLADEMLKARAR